jgi:hypothetical protein
LLWCEELQSTSLEDLVFWLKEIDYKKHRLFWKEVTKMYVNAIGLSKYLQIWNRFLILVSNWDSAMQKIPSFKFVLNFFKFLFLFSSPHDGLHSNDIALLKVVRRNDGTAIPFSDFVLPGLHWNACKSLTFPFTDFVLPGLHWKLLL